jgi:hypothetical protein
MESPRVRERVLLVVSCSAKDGNKDDGDDSDNDSADGGSNNGGG